MAVCFTMSRRKGLVWTIDESVFRDIVTSSMSFTEALSRLGVENHGCNHNALKDRAESICVDLSHIYKSIKNRASERCKLLRVSNIIPLEDVLVENSTYGRCNLKKRLIKLDLLDNKCHVCGMGPVWNDEPLVLVIDHINGVNNDNRLSNLRLLCPNCNSQTDTFAGRKLKKTRFCERCGTRINTPNMLYAKLCDECREKVNTDKEKVAHPTKDELEKMVWRIPSTQIAKDFGVSDRTIGDWCSKMGIKKPSKGYWSKVKAGRIDVQSTLSSGSTPLGAEVVICVKGEHYGRPVNLQEIRQW